MSNINDNLDPRSESIAWKPILKKNVPVLDYSGRPMYTTTFVPSKGKDIIFCPYCDKYTNLSSFDLGYGAREKGCVDCGMTMKDYHMMRVNIK